MVGLHLSTLWTCRRLYVARGCFFYLRELCAVLLRTPNCICEARDRPQYLKKKDAESESQWPSQHFRHGIEQDRTRSNRYMGMGQNWVPLQLDG